MNLRSFLSLAAFVLIVAGASAFGALFMPGEWYAALTKPPLNPPNWVFGPVWTLLYIGIAVAGWLVWQQKDAHEGSRIALGLWGTQLALNALWSYLFFGLERADLALIDIVVLLVVIAATLRWFLKLRPTAGYLFVPYLAWVGFATYLNAGIWYLNR
jgi:tryptophan-rich sensory protein